MKFVATILALVSAAQASDGPALFHRVSTFSICEQLDATCNTDKATNAETIWYFNTESGGTSLVYTDSEAENLGFVDITDPSKPKADGTVELPGEPTTVRVIGDYAVVGVNTSPDYVNVSGVLSVIDLASKEVVHEIDLPGQPDAVDVSKDTSSFPLYIAIAIENERDEDLGDGAPPQLPAGFLTIATISSEEALADPTTWKTSDIPLTGLDSACRFPEDPEPEYVAIHPDNKRVVVTLQENNCNLIVDLESGDILGAYDAGYVKLNKIDTIEDGLIFQVEEVPVQDVTQLSRETGDGLLREPDGVAWIGSTNYFATANEGDLDGGSRGWSIVDASNGEVVYDSGSSMEWVTAMIGHYPDERSGNKGNEPENVFYENFPDFGTEYVFVLSERSSVVFVYSIDSSVSPLSPKFVQILPVGLAPEGITAIPSQNLVAIASEKDERGDKFRSSIAVFKLGASETGTPEYPSLKSVARGSSPEGPPIPFSALSGLAAKSPYNTNGESTILYSVEDSFYKRNRILTIDTSSFPAYVTGEQNILDSYGVLSKCLMDYDQEVDVTTIVNEDDTVNIDPEGISMAAATGGFWVVSEGKGTIGDELKPFASPNLLLELDFAGTIVKCVLPDDSFEPQLRFGFEGVADDESMVVVALQRAWGEEENPRIAVYNNAEETWKHAFYPLDEPESQNGGWVGLSDITSLGNGKFLVLERDNQAGHDAAIKKIYSIDLGDYSWEDGTVLGKVLFKDLIADGDLTATNGQIIEKVEGLTVTAGGEVWINTDNDGVDDSSGESLLAKVAIYEDEDEEIEIEIESNGFQTMVAAASFLAPLLAMVA